MRVPRHWISCAFVVAAAAACGPPPKPVPAKAPEPAPVVKPPFPAEHKVQFEADLAEARAQAAAGAEARKEADNILKTTKNRAAARPAFKKAADHYSTAYKRMSVWTEESSKKIATFSAEVREHWIKPAIDERDRWLTQSNQAQMEINMR